MVRISTSLSYICAYMQNLLCAVTYIVHCFVEYKVLEHLLIYSENTVSCTVIKISSINLAVEYLHVRAQCTNSHYYYCHTQLFS